MIGRSFPLPVLEHVAASDDLDADVGALLRADIIRELRHYPEPEYVFRHGLLARPRSRRCHPTGGATSTGPWAAPSRRCTPPTLDDHLEVLAHYYARSHDLAKGLDYLERAGEKAAALDANAHAGAWKRAPSPPLGTRRLPSAFALVWRRSGPAEETKLEG